MTAKPWGATMREIWTDMFEGKQRTVNETLAWSRLEAARAIAEQLAGIQDELGRIADCLYGQPMKVRTIPPRPAVVLSDPPEGLANYARALQLVRDILDADGFFSHDSGRGKLFDVESLLSHELGQPVWEGVFRRLKESGRK